MANSLQQVRERLSAIRESNGAFVTKDAYVSDVEFLLDLFCPAETGGDPQVHGEPSEPEEAGLPVDEGD